MSDRLDDILTEFASAVYPLAAQHRGWNNSDQDKAEQALQSYIDTKIIDILEYLSEQAIEYGITDAERYAWQHKDEADQMMIPLKAVKEALNHRKENSHD